MFNVQPFLEAHGLHKNPAALLPLADLLGAARLWALAQGHTLSRDELTAALEDAGFKIAESGRGLVVVGIGLNDKPPLEVVDGKLVKHKHRLGRRS